MHARRPLPRTEQPRADSPHHAPHRRPGHWSPLRLALVGPRQGRAGVGGQRARGLLRVQSGNRVGLPQKARTRPHLPSTLGIPTSLNSHSRLSKTGTNSFRNANSLRFSQHRITAASSTTQVGPPPLTLGSMMTVDESLMCSFQILKPAEQGAQGAPQPSKPTAKFVN